MMKDICSYLYTKLAGIELKHEPSPELEDVIDAMDYIGSFGRLDSILGTALIDFETFKASPHIDINVMWTMLSQMEEANTQVADSQIADKCAMAWLRITLNEYHVYKKLPRRKRQKVLKTVLNLINGDNPNFTIQCQIDQDFIRELTRIIVCIRCQLELSSLLLSGRAMIDPSICFKSETASLTKMTKLFSLLSYFSLQRKFVTFDAVSWRRLLLECGVYLDDDDTHDILPVIETQCKKLRVFRQSLNFKKVGLGSCADCTQEFNRVTPPTNIPYIFDNCIHTDGHTIEFLFGKRRLILSHCQI
jgi:hypothetical protein